MMRYGRSKARLARVASTSPGYAPDHPVLCVCGSEPTLLPGIARYSAPCTIWAWRVEDNSVERVAAHA
jgi:hypothetical protein